MQVAAHVPKPEPLLLLLLVLPLPPLLPPPSSEGGFLGTVGEKSDPGSPLHAANPATTRTQGLSVSNFMMMVLFIPHAENPSCDR
jgi:hypothetical protein